MPCCVLVAGHSAEHFMELYSNLHYINCHKHSISPSLLRSSCPAVTPPPRPDVLCSTVWITHPPWLISVFLLAVPACFLSLFFPLLYVFSKSCHDLPVMNCDGLFCVWTCLHTHEDTNTNTNKNTDYFQLLNKVTIC